MTVNGATDLTDGSMAQPGGTLDEQADEGDDAVDTATEDGTTTLEDAPDDQSDHDE